MSQAGTLRGGTRRGGHGTDEPESAVVRDVSQARVVVLGMVGATSAALLARALLSGG